MKENTLRAWLRKTPQPARVRITTEDDCQREIALSEDVRGRWKSCEEAIIAARAVAVEALDADGKILRGERLAFDGEEGDLEGGEEREERYARKLVAGERKELAGVLEAQGRAIVRAYEAGADAAGASQEKLVGLVEILTAHLAQAISNLHKISVQYAQAVSGEETDKSSTNDDMVKAVLQGAISKALSGGDPNGAPAKKSKE